MSSTDSLSSVVARFAERAPAVDFWSLRVAETRRQDLCVRKGVVEPPAAISSLGAMVTVADGGGIGYAATCDLGSRGLAEAGEQARDWARRSGGCALIRQETLAMSHEVVEKNVGLLAVLVVLVVSVGGVVTIVPNAVLRPVVLRRRHPPARPDAR